MQSHLIRQGVELILEGIGVDISDPNFIDTPDRVARSYQEIFAGLDNTEDQVLDILNATFPCEHQQMIIAKNIEVFGMCPHHLLPVRYQITVGYMPGDNGRVLGISKLARLAKVIAAQPILQEQVVNDIAVALDSLSGCKGSGCIAHGEHYCMKMRGVSQIDAVITTSSLQGEFRDDPLVRSEFMSLMR